MPKITINQDKCKGCLLCIGFCPKGLISQDTDLNRHGVRPVKFSRQGRDPALAGQDDSTCIGCCLCAIICPECCIEVYK